MALRGAGMGATTVLEAPCVVRQRAAGDTGAAAPGVLEARAAVAPRAEGRVAPAAVHGALRPAPRPGRDAGTLRRRRIFARAAVRACEGAGRARAQARARGEGSSSGATLPQHALRLDLREHEDLWLRA